MSGFLAIAGVSATLRNLLRDRMEQPVDVTIAPPDVQVPGMLGRRVNLYLFEVVENVFLKNQEIPGRGHPADYGSPPLSLNLRYLLTAHGAQEASVDGDLEAQQILGDAMRVFHEFPLVTASLHENGNPADPLILDPSLVSEFERIKITLAPANLEEFSKIWTALPQANFRRSVLYEVTVVQIESRRERRSALPVRERRVYALTLRTPHIDRVRRDPPLPGADFAVAEAGDTVVITGYNLAAPATSVKIGQAAVPVPLPQDARIVVAVPAAQPAGLHAVQVVHEMMLEAQPGTLVAHRGFESNAAPLMVIPRLVSLLPAGATAGDLVTATVDPPALAAQRKSLLLGDREVQAEPVAPTSPPGAAIAFRLPAGAAAIAPGAYLARVRIDGAESRLTFNPATLQYDGPSYTVA